MSAAVVTLFRASNGATKGDKGEEDPVLKALTALQAPYVLDVSAGVFQALQALLAKVVPLAEAEPRAGGLCAYGHVYCSVLCVCVGVLCVDIGLGLRPWWVCLCCVCRRNVLFAISDSGIFSMCHAPPSKLIAAPRPSVVLSSL